MGIWTRSGVVRRGESHALCSCGQWYNHVMYIALGHRVIHVPVHVGVRGETDIYGPVPSYLGNPHIHLSLHLIPHKISAIAIGLPLLTVITVSSSPFPLSKSGKITTNPRIELTPPL